MPTDYTLIRSFRRTEVKRARPGPKSTPDPSRACFSGPRGYHRGVTERLAMTTNVRRPRTALLWTVAGLTVAFFVVATVLRVHVGPLPWWVLLPLFAAIQRRPKITRSAIEASTEGLRIGGELVPRASLSTALLRRESGRSYVTLRNKSRMGGHVDVEVSDDEQADRLCRALALDAASTTAEFTLFRAQKASRRARAFALAAVAGVMVMVGWTAALSTLPAFLIPLLLVAPLLLMLVAIPIVAFHRRVKLRVGADGLVVREGFGRRRFVPHDDVTETRASGNHVVLAQKKGDLVYSVGEERRRRRREELEQTAQSIVWRIDKAREAYRELAGDAPQAALALDRGEASAREWLDRLRAIGAGANATFRSAQMTREQLLRVVESTTAAAKARLAALAALHDGLTEEEKPRIRVAAERCAEPALGERMVRVAFAPSEEELESALVSDDDERAAS